MTIKCTALFQLGTASSNPSAPVRRLGGWSESWYYTGTSFSTAAFAFGAPQNAGCFCSLRAAILPVGGVIVGQRYQQVTPVLGGAVATSNNFPAAGFGETDSPQQALLCRVGGLGVSNVKRLVLRGLPDAEIFEGEYRPDFAFTLALNTLFASLPNFQFRGRDLAQPTFKIITISAAGLVTCEAAVPFPALSEVRILRTLTAGGRLRGGRFQVATTGPGVNQFTLVNWTQGATVGGSVRADVTVFSTVDGNNVAALRTITRRVGRPFVQYRGRRSAKRP